MTAAARHITIATERAVFKRDDLLAVMAIARRAARPSDLCVDLVKLRFQTRGIPMSDEQAEEIAKEIIAAATYNPPPM